MAVTDEQLATLRALLAGDFDRHRQLLEQLDRQAASTGYTALIAAAFFKAVYRRFGVGGTSADVIEFVGDVRARSVGTDTSIDPQTAERAIRAALGDGSVTDLDDETRVGTQILLLGVLIADEQLDDEGLDQFMTDARKLADEWLA